MLNQGFYVGLVKKKKITLFEMNQVQSLLDSKMKNVRKEVIVFARAC